MDKNTLQNALNNLNEIRKQSKLNEAEHIQLISDVKVLQELINKSFPEEKQSEKQE